jgi:uncharacterized protein YecE (DUF72 family)
VDFGKVKDPSAVNFKLPSTSILSEQVFNTLTPGAETKIYIGCPVWGDKGYVGKVFPKGTKPVNYLREYCKQFNAIEVNATHYKIPEKRTIERWKEVAPIGFKFCPKLPQIISHHRHIDKQKEWLDLFLTTIYDLGEHLGTTFIQFPPFFKPDRLEELQLFLEQLPVDMSFAVELRNKEWFLPSVWQHCFTLFRHYNIVPVITDTSGRRDVIHQTLTREQVFIRFTGNNLHPTDYRRIDDWIERLLEWIERGVQEVYFFVHEPQKPLCADIIAYMIQQFNKKGNGVRLKAPNFYKDSTGTLF